jgi:integrase
MNGEIIERGKNKKGELVYQIRIFLGWIEKNGKKTKKYHFQTVKMKKKSVAELDRLRNELLAKFHKGEIKETNTMTISEYLDHWIEVSLKNSVEPRTYYDYKTKSDRYIKKEIGHIRLIKLTPEQIQKFYNDLTQRGLSASTVRHTHAILRRALRQAVIWRYLPHNPAQLINLPKMRKREMKVLSLAQAECFLEAAASNTHYALWMVALDGGLSPEEYFGLQWQDYQDGALHIQRALCRDGFDHSIFYFKEPKAEKRRRRVPLSPATREALDDHRRRQLEWKLKRGEKYKNPNNLIFTSRLGSPLDLSTLRRDFQKILKQAGLPTGFRLYDLRHTMATMALLKNVHTKKVQDRLGHSTYVLTMDTYSHILPEMQDDVSSALDNALFSKVKPKTSPK